MIRNLQLAVGTSVFAIALAATSAGQDITTGLVGHWKLDEGFGATAAIDSIAANNGTVQGAVTTGLSGRVDNGYTFAGTGGNRVLTTATATGLGVATGPMSMFAFVKTSDLGTVQQHIFSGNNGAAGRWNLGIVADTDNPGFSELFWFHNGGLGAVNSNVHVSDNEFRLVGVSRDAADAWNLYVDNTVIPIGTSSAALNASAISFGERPNASQFPFEGILDDMRIYNRVLSPADISALLAQPTPPPTPNQWLRNGSGSWFTEANWLDGAPNGNTETARFGVSPTVANATVIVDSPVTMKGITFDNSVTHYIVAGTQTVTMQSNAGPSTLNVEQSGSHEFQAAVALGNALTAQIAEGGQLDFNNALSLNGNTLTKSGAGVLNINNQVNSGTGVVNVTAGTLGGSGEVGGNLSVQSGATVAPGRGTGTLAVAGNYSQLAGGRLAIELGGANVEDYDSIDVQGSATVAGLIDISLVEGFVPQNGASFEILSAFSSLTMGTLALQGDTAGFSLMKAGNSLVLNYAGSAGTPGDFNGDGAVNLADYTVWRDNLGSSTALPNDNNLGTPVAAAHYQLWKSNFGLGGNGTLSSSVAVPEASSLWSVVLLGFVALVASRKVA
ncbi:LamG-like jellyroll fold domain-containing protein [Aeoliella sp. SH292]|uniref:LamG-like jellyroll fold domain-containing protein n=1 Tax=Aeoliella sp. SH292 TaxID=3454464 RepID=UPI003F9671AD